MWQQLILWCVVAWFSTAGAADPPMHVYVRPIPQTPPGYRSLQSPSQPLVLMESRQPSNFDHFPPPPSSNIGDYLSNSGYQAPIPHRPLREEHHDSGPKEIPAPSLSRPVDYNEKSVPSSAIQGRALFSGEHPQQQSIVKAPASEIQKEVHPKTEKATKDEEYVIYYYYYYDNVTNPNANLTNEFDDIPNLESYDKTLPPPPSNKVRPAPRMTEVIPQAMPREAPAPLNMDLPPIQPVSNVFRYGNLDTPRIPITPLPVGYSPEPPTTEAIIKLQEESNDVETDTEPATEPPTTLPPTTTTTEIPTTTTTERTRKRPPRIGNSKFGSTRRTTTSTTTTTTSAPISSTTRGNRFRRPSSSPGTGGNPRFNRNRRISTTTTTTESVASAAQQPAKRTTTAAPPPRRPLPSRPTQAARAPGRSLEAPARAPPSIFRNRNRSRSPLFKRPGAKEETEEPKIEEETTTITEDLETTTASDVEELEAETTVATEIPTTTTTTERPGPGALLRRNRKRPQFLPRPQLS